MFGWNHTGGRPSRCCGSTAASGPSPVVVDLPRYYAPFLLDRETSDRELSQWGGAHIPGFLGCVSRTEYSTLYPPHSPMPPGSSCIVNLDGDYRHGGTHWCAARVSSSAPLVLYFDPFGLPPPRELTERSREARREILYQDIDMQFEDDTNCGPRCLAFLSYMAENAAAGDELSAYARVAQVD